MTYTSSIISKYGDTDNVSRDVKKLLEIMASQGSQLLIDVIAEEAGASANRLKLTEPERNNLRRSLTNSLYNALKERL